MGSIIKSFLLEVFSVGFIIHLFSLIVCIVLIAGEFLEYAIFLDSINISRYAAMLAYSLIIGSLCYFITSGLEKM